jgi:integrase/recombinase XerC
LVIRSLPVKRNFGYAVAKAYAGHTDGEAGATVTYVRATTHEVATAGPR